MNKLSQLIEQLLRHRVLTHVLYWVFVVGTYLFYGSIYDQSLWVALKIKLGYLPLQIVASYVLMYYQIPRFLDQKKYISFLISVLVSLFVFAFLHHVAEDFLLVYFLGRFHPGHTILQILENPFIFRGFFFWTAFLIPTLTAGVKMIKQAYERQQQLARLQREKTQAEVALLKARLQPRFLINTLHTLHRLTLEKSPQAPEVVINLSEILDYMLYKCQGEQALLREEMGLLEKYFALEQLRWGEQLELEFAHVQTDPEAHIVPLLLLSLAEKITEKGISSSKSPTQVALKVTEDSQRLHYHLTQSTQGLSSQRYESLQRQLELTYPNRHQWDMKIAADTLQLDLTLEL